jgi:hypothetical protein
MEGSGHSATRLSATGGQAEGTGGQADSELVPKGQIDLSEIDPQLENSPIVADDSQDQSKATSSGERDVVSYVPTFSCFQRTLHHTVLREDNDDDYSDTTTFSELRKTYSNSLGRLGKWRIVLSLRSLKKITKIAVCTPCF